MSDMQQNERPGAPGTTEGESGPSESEPTSPSVEGREPVEQEGEGQGG